MSDEPAQLSADEAFPAADELPAFDDRAARRAIRRGILRTAVTALLLAVFGLILLEFASHIWQTRGDREGQFQAVAGLGFLVANPGWEGEPSGCCNTDLTSMELFLDMWPQGASPSGQRTEAWLRLNLLGRLERESIPRLPDTPIDEALSRGRPEKEATGELLDQLPQPVRSLAIVELLEPQRAQDLMDLLSSGSLDWPPIFLEPPYPRFDDISASVVLHKLTWPAPNIASAAAGPDGELSLADPLTQFKAWAAMLDEGDDGNLEKLGLPPSKDIKGLAESPGVHGFILTRATVTELEALLADPRVRSVNVADVAFDLSQGKSGSP